MVSLASAAAEIRRHGIHCEVHGEANFDSLTCDSRKCGEGSCFAALPGVKADGAAFIAAAREKGAAAVLAEALPEGVPGLICLQPRAAFAVLASFLAGHPGERLLSAAVTGTNGKTSTCLMLVHILEQSGRKTGVLGTVGYGWSGMRREAPWTTPAPEVLQPILAEMLAAGVTHLCLEASSHALDQQRLEPLRFRVGIFTNLSRDHLDYHTDMEEYFQAKAGLFRNMLAPGALAVIHADDEAGRRLAAEMPHCLDFGRDHGKHRISAEIANADGTSFVLDGVRCHVPVPGAFSVANAAGALLAATAFGLPLEQAAAALRSFPGVPGRMENIPLGPGRRGVVDYAHTPDGLDKALVALAGCAPRPLVCVFGCGGDRDRGKRPLMAAVATEHADAVIVTDDNPRTEDAAVIFDDIRPGLKASVPVRFLHSRRAAIAAGLELIASGGTLLVAGKGHEDYQIIGTVKHRFSDQDEIRRLSSSQPTCGH